MRTIYKSTSPFHFYFCGTATEFKNEISKINTYKPSHEMSNEEQDETWNSNDGYAE